MIAHRKGFYEKYIKRLLDIVCALAALIVFSWLYAIIAVLVRIKLGSPVIFKQERPGKIDPKTGKERIFMLYKFRTMKNERVEKGELMTDEVKLTPFGKWLRSWSLDELPEAWNILIGDMSVIGPRPLLVKYLPRYNAYQHRRHEVRPGLSGYAQVHGRNKLTWEEKFKLDVWYVEHISFLGDVKIVLETVSAVLRREGINSETSVIMEEFKGQSGGPGMNRKVVLIGAGGQGKVVADIVRSSGDEVLGFLDDTTELKQFIGLPVLGGSYDYKDFKDAEFVITVGNAAARERIAGMLTDVKWYTAIHPTAVISETDTKIGCGTVVMANAVINSGAHIGNHCIVNTGAIIEHDNELCDFVHASVGVKLGGTVCVGKGTWIGIGTTVNNNVKICGNCMIGAGAVVIKDINEPGTYIGVPVRKKTGLGVNV